MELILPHNNSFINTNSIHSSPNPIFWESNYTNFSVSFIQQLFINILHDIDESFFHSDQRIRSYYSKDKQLRTLVTSFGTISFYRRRYIHKDSRSSFHYIDYLLGIDKYQRVTSQVQANILHSIGFEHDSYRKATAPFGLSKSYAYSLIKKLSCYHQVPYLQKPIICSHLHLVADEDHVALQNKKKRKSLNTTNRYMLRHVTIFTDIQRVCKGRNKLNNRIILSQFETETVKEFSSRVNEFILHNYQVKEEVYVYGDGAAWIQTLNDEVCGTFILDKFHMKQALFRICGGKTNKGLREVLESYLQADNKEMFMLIVKTIYGDKMSLFKQQQLQYITNFWESYQKNFKIPAALWCCAEGINSHYFADYLSSRPKGFSKSNIHKIGYLLSLSHSHKDLRYYYVEKITEFIEEKEVRRLNEADTRRIERIRKNIPILNIGKATGTYQLLKSILH